MPRRILAILTVLVMLFGCAAAEDTAAAESHRIEMRTYPFYLNSVEEKWPEDFPLYFVDGVDDLPFVEVNDWAAVLNWYFRKEGGYPFKNYQLTVEIPEGKNIVLFKRENGSVMMMDFSEGTFFWDDYGKFLQGAGDYTTLSWIKTMRDDGQVHLIQTVKEQIRGAKSTLLNLAEYQIPMIAQDGKFLLPLQTLSTFSLILLYRGMYFNQESLIMADGMKMRLPADIMNQLLDLITPEILAAATEHASSPEEAQILAAQVVAQSEEGMALIAKGREEMAKSVYKLYVNGKKGERSETLALFSLRELCLELDAFYGQKTEHHIDSFAEFLDQTNLAVPIMWGTLQQAEDAAYSLAQGWLDDNHTTFLSHSYLTQTNDNGPDALTGFSTMQLQDYVSSLSQIRAQHPEATQWYYEEGDTAFLNLTRFSLEDNLDYYEAAEKGELPDPNNDTMSLVIQAHQRITRENSPVRNVVLDLSTNFGGASAAAIYVLGWFLGDAHVSLHNTFTGAETTSEYRVDVNLDHKCDESDTISRLNLYCLTSPHSFSCGNLVPWAFKEDGRVTLLGKTTGGGACVLLPLNTAWGATFTISGPQVLSFVKNGAYYSVDRGAEPDVFIRDYENFFDRKALTEIIHGLR